MQANGKGQSKRSENSSGLNFEMVAEGYGSIC